MLNIRFREKTNAWPGFVDLFSNLVIILIFLLIVFVFLWTTTSVFNKNTGAKKVADLTQTTQEQAEQIEQMTATQQEAEQLLLAARDALITQESQIETQQIQAENLANAYEDQIAKLTTQQEQLVAQIAVLTEQLKLAVAEKQEISQQSAEDRQDILSQANAEISELTAHIAKLEATLQDAEATAKSKEIEYVEMSNRLNKALAEKVAELKSMKQYQSEFYKQIKIALGDETSIKTDGDRFIVPSDILFQSGSYKISPDGKSQLKLLANVIKNLETKIPQDIDWIIRVDGHTDNKTVIPGTAGYKNNMELSLLRATAVVNELVRDGVAKKRLVPSGFGSLSPVDNGTDTAALQRNRRIELQLTNR